MERSYEEAILCLNSRKASPKRSLDDMRGSDDMVEWLKLLGHSVEDLDCLSSIHVAGTKGKGSTCAFAASFLKTHGESTGHPRKVGLYTSPHMEHVRERIRINNQPLSIKQFTIRFFEIWDKLPEQPTPRLDIPRYLQLLALLSFHVFIEEKVDVAIYETHMGGEFDATNIITPLVAAITPIAEDHIRLLGPTIQDVAWHKAGIFKPGSSAAFSAHQEDVVSTVLQRRASEKRLKLECIEINSELPHQDTILKPRAQLINCSLALALVRAWLSISGQQPLEEIDIARGIEQFSWPGRYQQIHDRCYHWFLDGAHTYTSFRYAVEWFAGEVKKYPSTNYILIFSHFSARDGVGLLRNIASSLRDQNIQVQHVIFSSYDERLDGQTRIDRNLKTRFSPELQDRYVKVWNEIDATATVLQERTIEGALNRAREIGDQSNGMQVLITGSLHLVSGANHLLNSDHGKGY